MATIHDVARAAGVSSATVSRVMNNAACVLPQTQRRVEEAIRALNYQPNQFSRNLRLGESRMLLVLAPNLQNTFYGDMLEAMDECAQQNGYNLLIVSTHMDRQRETRLCDFLHNRQADGALFMSAAQSPEQITALSETYPVVQVCEFSEGTQVPHVSIDDYQAFCDVVSGLIALGHRRIAMFSDEGDAHSLLQRKLAYRHTLERAGIPWDESLLMHAGYSYKSGYALAQRALTLEDRPTAYACICDSVAIGAMAALSDHGVRVPHDVSVTGFDGQTVTEMLRPGLTTVSQPVRLLGKTAIELLISRIHDGACEAAVTLPHEVIWRGSTAEKR